MKIRVDKSEFLKSWGVAVRSAGAAAGNIFSSVLIVADYDRVELQATSIRTSVVCRAQGVEVIEPGSATLPLKGVSELFTKAPGDGFTIDIKDGRASMTAGKSRYRFAVYAASEFPKLPSSADAALFCSVRAGELAVALERGKQCASTKAEHPTYLSSALLQLTEADLCVISTDKRRVAISRVETDAVGETGSILLPIQGILELQRLLGSQSDDAEVRILHDDSQAYFAIGDCEFAARKNDGSFPPYERVLSDTIVSTIEVDKRELLSAIERVNVVVGGSNRVIYIHQRPDESLVLLGKSPDVGTAVEHISSSLTGPEVLCALNVHFLRDAVGGVDVDVVTLSTGQIQTASVFVAGKSSDRFWCNLAGLDNDFSDLGATIAAIASDADE